MAGSYVPRLLAGAPSDDGDAYLLWQTGDIQLFYSPMLRPKPYTDVIRIHLKRFLFIKCLELEGARAIIAAPAEQHLPEEPPVSPD